MCVIKECNGKTGEIKEQQIELAMLLRHHRGEQPTENRKKISAS
jgi:hypothetical protein